MNNHGGNGAIPLSIVITAYNEGEEVRRTLDSIAANTVGPYEVVLVDDGSTDGSCDAVGSENIRVVRHTERVGIASSRNEGCSLARGDVLAFLDAHQRLSPRCLNQCAELALARKAIVWPDVRGLKDRDWTGHGAFLRLCKDRGFFQADWNRRTPRDPISRISTLVVPGYVMPRDVYEKVFWIKSLRGWGASEPAITVKAFFQDIDLLHLCGPLARHYFREGGQIPYSAPWESVWRNHALVARVCFDDRTWYEHWLPNVFYQHLTPAVRREMESPEVVNEHEMFLAQKVRPDREFWRGLLQIEEPACLRP
jgi:glycosyltransferase involved in cell wall biosynthesis